MHDDYILWSMDLWYFHVRSLFTIALSMLAFRQPLLPQSDDSET